MAKNNKTVCDRMAISVDVPILSIYEDELAVLLVKRENDPHQGEWALPGALMRAGESPKDTAKRVLQEKLGIKNIYLDSLGWSEKTNRDPREQVMGLAYLGIVDYQSLKIKEHQITDHKWVKVSDVKKLAFDHKNFVKMAEKKFKNQVQYTPIGFYLVPDVFTMPELKNVLEKALDRKLNLSNFRTKLQKLDVLVETGEVRKTGGKGKPAPLWQLDYEKLNELKKTETIFN